MANNSMKNFPFSGMGPALTPAEEAAWQAKLDAHNKFVDRRAGREFDAGAHDHHAHNCNCAYHYEPCPDFSFEETDIDPEAVRSFINAPTESNLNVEAVLDFIDSRQEVLGKARATLRGQHNEIQHLKAEIQTRDKKIKLLQEAIEKLRQTTP